MLVFPWICKMEHCWVYESDCSVTREAQMQHVRCHSPHAVEIVNIESYLEFQATKKIPPGLLYF